MSEEVLVLAPLAADREALMQAVGELRESGRSVEGAAIGSELSKGAGLLVLTEEALTDDVLGQVSDWAHGQPDWSALPVVVLSRSSQRLPGKLRRILDDGSGTGLSVTILPRPATPTVLANALTSGLQGRRRQYRIREQIRQLDRDKVELEMLAEEVQHRAKNTLSRLQAILHQTRRGARNLSEFVPLFEDRMQALSRGQDLLNRARWRGASLETLVASEIDAVAPGARERVRMSGDDLMLSTGAVLGFQLVFHELTTNAIKYGALSNEQGKVDVQWSVEEDNDRLIVRWEERDGPPVRPPKRRGFGSTLIERALSEFDSAARMDFSATGLRCQISLTLRDLLVGE